MPNFSRDPLQELLDNRERGYVGLRVEQGVPVLDRDLNLLADLVASTVREVFAQHLGNGVAEENNAFLVQALPADNDFRIVAPAEGGACLVAGIRVLIETSILYSEQDGVAPLTAPTPAQPDPREDTVYLDVWVDEVDATEDATLENAADVGMQTSVRLRPAWRVRVSEGAPAPAAVAGHAHHPIATLTRPRAVNEVRPAMVTDLRSTGLNLGELERRVRMMEGLIFYPSFAAAGGNQFTPMVGSPGSSVTLRGNNFHVGTVRVHFGGVEALVLAPPEETELLVRVPAGASGAVSITVTTGAGSTTSDDVFTVLAGGGDGGGQPDQGPAFAPAGSQFSPATGQPGDAVTLLGNNFDDPPLSVFFGTAFAPVVGAPTNNQITTQVPAGMPPGAVQITVDTASGTVTSADTFTVVAPVVAPAFGPSGGGQFTPMVGNVGDLVTISGSGFNAAGLQVRFVRGGTVVLAAISGAPSATQIQVLVPPGAAFGPNRIRVDTANGTVTSDDTFNILP